MARNPGGVHPASSSRALTDRRRHGRPPLAPEARDVAERDPRSEPRFASSTPTNPTGNADDAGGPPAVVVRRAGGPRRAPWGRCRSRRRPRRRPAAGASEGRRPSGSGPRRRGERFRRLGLVKSADGGRRPAARPGRGGRPARSISTSVITEAPGPQGRDGRIDRPGAEPGVRRRSRNRPTRGSSARTTARSAGSAGSRPELPVDDRQRLGHDPIAPPARRAKAARPGRLGPLLRRVRSAA